MENSGTSFLEIFTEKTGLDIHEVEELYLLFLEELESEIIELKCSVDMEDFKKAQQVAHNIKGITSNYLAIKVYSIAEAVDLQLKAGIYEKFTVHVQELISEAQCFKSKVLEAITRKDISIGG